MQKTVYYAHAMALYDTPQEKRDVATLERLGFKVYNPNNQELSNAFQVALSRCRKHYDETKENFEQVLAIIDPQKDTVGYLQAKEQLDNFLEKSSNSAYLRAFDEVFGEKVRECDVIAFRALPHGKIPGGVVMEVDVARATHKRGFDGKVIDIIELPSGITDRSMGKDDTREFLAEIGQR